MDRLDRVPARWTLALASLATTAGLVGLGRHRERRATTRTTERLLGRADGQPKRVTHDDLDGLPTPVSRYFETVLPDREYPVGPVRLAQTGRLRVGGADTPWKRFTATHYASVCHPGFVWDATVELFPFVSVQVRDAFVDGEGSGRVTLFGAVPVGGAGPTPELNEAALQRYLAEAVWYPTALLPENGVTWEGIDDHSARATLRQGWTEASLVFHFSDEGEVERVHAAQRYRRVGDGFEPTPWTGLWRDYEERGGVRIPTEGAVIWHLPEGDLHAWHGRVEVCE